MEKPFPITIDEGKEWENGIGGNGVGGQRLHVWNRFFFGGGAAGVVIATSCSTITTLHRAQG